jgi:CRP-like cAMP-binding protein
MALQQPLGSGRRNATVTAVTDAEIYAGSAAEFRRILEASPSVAKKVEELIESRKLTAETLVAA